MRDFEDIIKYWPIEQLKILRLFLTKDNGIIDYSDILKQLNLKEDKLDPKTGNSLGGILSALRRKKVENEPLIVPLGRLLGSRTLQWKINQKVFTPDVKDQYVVSLDEILDKRGIKP